MFDAFLPPETRERFNDPRMQAAMLQLGLSLMQPTGLGQSAGGHIGQAIGQAAAAAGRQEGLDLKEQQADLKTAATIERMNNAAERLKLSGENADLRRQATSTKSLNDILEQRRKRRGELGKAADDEAKFIIQRRDADQWALTPDPELARYKGKSRAEIAQMLVNDPDFQKQRAAVTGETPEKQQGGVDASIANARAAIAAGKSRAAVIARLRQNGIEPPGDL